MAQSYRLFLTSFQKSGTHQAMQMLMHNIPSIVDRSGVNTRGLEAYGFTYKKPRKQYVETIEALRGFQKKAFGHISYVPEYVTALQTHPTKVLFNIRDPRDVVNSEYQFMRAMQIENKGEPFPFFQNMVLPDRRGMRLMDSEDPIKELIIIGAIRWSNYIGWMDQDLVTVVKYEDLRMNTELEVQRLARVLRGCYLPSPGAMVSQARNTGWAGKHFRKGLVAEWKTNFTDAHKELAANEFGPLLERMGYDA